MDTRAFFAYLGLPSLFIMLCMIAVGCVGLYANRKFMRKLFKWITAWGTLGCFLAISLAIAAWVMNTDFVYSHASMVWPFRLLLIVLDSHPSLGAGLLLIGLMGVMNGLYYALMAALTWTIIRLLPQEILRSRVQRIVGAIQEPGLAGAVQTMSRPKEHS
jgi:hypothetical protein